MRRARKPYAKQSERDEVKPINEERAREKTFKRAVNLLTYKPRSIRELRERLLEKPWTNAKVVEEVVQKLLTYGYLDDEKFARDFASAKLRGKPQGKRVIGQKLYRRKLPRETIEKALSDVFEETPESGLISRAIEKRVALKGKPETREETKKLYDFLMRQGFSYDLIREKLRELQKGVDD